MALQNQVVVVDSHHHVLPAWAKLRRELGVAPRLLTLDYHTDTSQPFRNFIRRLNLDAESAMIEQKKLIDLMDWRKPTSIQEALQQLSHDEHILTALKTDIISSALVVAHNAYDTDLETYRKHQVICVGVDRKENSSGIVRSDCDVVLESSFLEERLDQLNQVLISAQEVPIDDSPYIFDLDLDYLNTFSSVVPHDASTFLRLMRNASLITVAKEDQHVLHCSLDPQLTSGYLLQQIQKLIEQ